MSDIWALILAAGESKRMGTPKMLLPFKGLTMIENVINNVRSSGLNNIMVVLGSELENIKELIKTKGVNYCYNENYRDGMLSSVICGFRNIPTDHRAVLVFQGDQPLISPAVSTKIIEHYILSGKGIVIPVYNKKRGHPILIDRKYRDNIGRLNPEKGLRSLLDLFPFDILEVESTDPGILRDFDTIEEYRKETNQF
jgi:molybdenum cofactor cytidylyltransferase